MSTRTYESFLSTGSGTFTAPYDGYFDFLCVGAGGPAGAGRFTRQGGPGGSGAVSGRRQWMNKGDQATYTNVAGAPGGVSATNAGTPSSDSPDGCQWVINSVVVCKANSGKRGTGGVIGVDGSAGTGGSTTGAVGDYTLAGTTGNLVSGSVSTGGAPPAPDASLGFPAMGTGGVRGNPGGNGIQAGGGGGGGQTSGNDGGNGADSGCYVGYYLHEEWS